MSWSCRRPGCGREAEVCITYDAVACQVWLDPISVGPPGGQPLCGDHAARLSAPRGWVVMDRRTSQAALLTPAVATPPAVARPRRRLPRGWGQFEAPRLDFVAEEATALVEPSMVADVTVTVTAPVVGEPADVLPVASVVEDPAEVLSESSVVVEPATEPATVAAADPVPIVEPVVALIVEPVVEPVAEPVAPPAEPATAPAVAPAASAAVVAEAPPSRRRAASSKPRGRLLSRAFESTGHQRSVITDALGRDGETEPPPD